MRNQIAAANRAGIVARTINSANLPEWNGVYDEILDGQIDALLVSPERLNHPDFRDYILPKLGAATGLVVIDEVHCISDWGHDFRPDYRRIRSLLDELSSEIPVLATTATANARVIADVADQLGHTLVLRGALDRESLRLTVLSLPTSGHRLAWLADHLGNLPGSGIIYTLTVGGTEQAASFLRSRGYDVIAYSSKTNDAERRAAEVDLIENRLKALVATSALGMGFDKADLGFVVHLGAPPSPIAYYQQIGRAGRAINTAIVVLLPSIQDLPIWQYFAMLTFPPEKQVRVVLEALAAARQPLSTQVLETRVDLSRGRLEHMLKVLDVDGAVRKVEGGWVSTGEEWHHDAERYERVTAARIAEQDAILEYIATGKCRLEFLRRCLDDSTAEPCGRCDNCAGVFLPCHVSSEAMDALQAHVSSVGVDITPRTIWPTGLRALGIPLFGRVASGEMALSGRAIARLTDIGWGEQLRALLTEAGPDQPIPQKVVDLANKVLDDWEQTHDPGLVGVVAIESTRRTALVLGLANGIATRRQLPLLGMLTGGGSPGNSTTANANSPRRVAALYSRFAVSPLLATECQRLRGTLLLIDDVVDSGWTMTLAARSLRIAGAERVLPFALATAGRRD
jgi:ATP-dependent DNA helicase RecQ